MMWIELIAGSEEYAFCYRGVVYIHVHQISEYRPDDDCDTIIMASGAEYNVFNTDSRKLLAASIGAYKHES